MRLLIAEDDPALGRFLARGMEQDGHEVTMATDGEMAMAAARNDLPEMAVLDLNLPRRDGTEVLEFLRSLTDDLPILILTARAEPEIRLRCLEMGADDFMQKPFSFAELRARCRRLLRRRSPGLVLRHGDVELKRVERSVTRNGNPITSAGCDLPVESRISQHSPTEQGGPSDSMAWPVASRCQRVTGSPNINSAARFAYHNQRHF